MIENPNAPVVPRSDAQRRCQRIKLLLGAMVDNREKVLALITEASESDDHIALGFPSWTAYVSTEYAGLLAELTRDDRRFAAFALAQTGMSSRAIAPLVGADHSTVVRDINQGKRSCQDQVVHRAPPGDDWRSLPAVKAISNREIVVTPTEKVVGIDGKRYARPEPRPRLKPKRRPLPVAWRDALYQLEKDVDRLARLAADDRFRAHRADLAQVGDLTRISKKLWKARQALAGEAALPLGGGE